MKKIRLLFVLLSILGNTVIANAQNGNSETTVGEFMRSNQRSYVVIAVMLTILIGLILYVVRLDLRIGKMEKETK